MSDKNKFIQAILDRKKEIDPAKYEPEFEIGDVICNDKFKVISKVVNIKLRQADVRDKQGRLLAYNEGPEVPHYILRDYENYAAKEYFKNNNSQLDMKRRKRYKECIRIDGTYTKMDPLKVKILFGERNE